MEGSMFWFLLWLSGFAMHRIMYFILGLGNNGEAEAKEGQGTLLAKPVTTQEQFDAMISERINRERSKYSDYEDLKKFRDDAVAKQDKHQQEELEKAKKYEEAKKNYESQLNQHKELVSKKDAELQDLRISHSLINEINKQNGYAEETLALIKQTAVLDPNGNVFIKGKDANGIDTQLPVTEGIKRFLEQRPYLVKSTHKAGAGSAGGNTTPTPTPMLNLSELNQQLSEAMTHGDHKKVKELSDKIRSIKPNAGKSAV